MGTAVCLALIPMVHNPSTVVALLTLGYGLTSAANSGCFSSVFDNAPRTCSAVYGLANCVGMSQGVISPYITGVFLKAASAGSSDSASSSDSETTDGWSYVWCLSAALAAAGAVVLQLVSTGEVIEGQWLEPGATEQRKTSGPPGLVGQLREIQ